MKEMFTTKRGRVHAIYLLGLIGMIILVILTLCTRTNVPPLNGNNSYVDISDDWHLSARGNEEVSLMKPSEYLGEDDTTLTLYYTLPEEISGSTALIYRTKDTYSKLFADGELLYETARPDSRFYNRSPGNIWNVVDISEKRGGQTLRLEITMVYDKSAFTIDHTYLGDKLCIVSDMVHKKMWAIILSLFMILIGIVLIVMEIVTKKDIKNHDEDLTKSKGMFYLGLYSLLIGVWSLLETNTLQFFVADARLLQLLNNITMIVDTLPLFLYLDCEQGILKSRIPRWLCVIDSVYIVFCFVMQITGLKDLHDVLLGAQIALLVGNILYIYIAVRLFKAIKKDKVRRAQLILQMCGISALIFSGLMEYAKYSQIDSMDRAGNLRVGILIFIVCCGIGTQMNTNRLIKQGLEYDIVSKLAYNDGLTGLGNRTAYLEFLDVCTKKRVSKLGIVFLDINNLKYVNDNLGHDMGDALIKEAARIISESFGKVGGVFRIGGDEFCALIKSESPDEDYNTARERFEKLIEESNANNAHHLEIHIAHGFCVCTEISKENVDAAIKTADEAMYVDKANLKKIYKIGAA